MLKWFAAILIVATVLLQHRLWLSPDGVREVSRLQVDVQAQRVTNGELGLRNLQLAAEVTDLKTGMTALEERARSELGMIARNESFFQVVPHAVQAPAAPPRTRTAARP